MDEWIKKFGYICRMKHYPAMSNKEVLPFATTCMDSEGIMLSETSDRKGQMLYDFTYMWNLRMSNLQKHYRMMGTQS